MKLADSHDIWYEHSTTEKTLIHHFHLAPSSGQSFGLFNTLVYDQISNIILAKHQHPYSLFFIWIPISFHKVVASCPIASLPGVYTKIVTTKQTAI